MTISYEQSVVTVDHDEMAGSPTESQVGGIFSAKRVLKCAWGDRQQMTEELLGGAVDFGGFDNGNMRIKTGALYPFRDQKDTQAIKVSITPFFAQNVQADGFSSRAKYDEALITVMYDNTRDTGDTEGGSEDQNQETHHRIESFTEFLTGPPLLICNKDGAGYSPGSPEDWEVVGETVEQTKLVTGFDWTFTRFKMPAIGKASFELMGSVNKGGIFVKKLGFNFPKHTLLYRGASLTSGRSVAGVLQWDIEYRFGYRGGDAANGHATWNKFWDFKTQKWISITRCDKGGDFDPYGEVDLMQIILPNIPPVIEGN